MFARNDIASSSQIFYYLHTDGTSNFHGIKMQPAPTVCIVYGNAMIIFYLFRVCPVTFSLSDKKVDKERKVRNL